MRILVVPDCQIKEGVPLEHLTWAGKAIVDYKPDVVVNIGDFADMPSLSSHDIKGSKYFEGLRYKKDVEAAKEAMKLLLAPLKEAQKAQKESKHKVYKPRMVMTLGNHENRIDRAVNNNPTLEGLISTKDLEYEKDWEVHSFLHPVFINGVGFNHYWPVGPWDDQQGLQVLLLICFICLVLLDTNKVSRLPTENVLMESLFVLSSLALIIYMMRVTWINLATVIGGAY